MWRQRVRSALSASLRIDGQPRGACTIARGNYQENQNYWQPRRESKGRSYDCKCWLLRILEPKQERYILVMIFSPCFSIFYLLWDPCDHLGVSKRMVIWGRCGWCWFIPSLWTPHTPPSITANSIGGRELATQPVFGNSRSRTRSPAVEKICKWPTNKPRTCNIQTRWTPGR